MGTYDRSRKNYLQWGLRVLPPDKYFNLLKRYTKKLFPRAYEEIYKAHCEDRDGYWWWKSLCCYISKEKRWFNIATARWVSNYNSERIGVFANWTQYEKFREALRVATEKYFSHQSNCGLTIEKSPECSGKMPQIIGRPLRPRFFSGGFLNFFSRVLESEMLKISEGLPLAKTERPLKIPRRFP